MECLLRMKPTPSSLEARPTIRAVRGRTDGLKNRVLCYVCALQCDTCDAGNSGACRGFRSGSTILIPLSMSPVANASLFALHFSPSQPVTTLTTVANYESH